MRRLFQISGAEHKSVDLIADITFLSRMFILLFGTTGLVILDKLKEVFRISPSILSIVSDRWDEASMNSLGIPNIRVRDGGFGTDAEEAFNEYAIFRTRISDAIKRIKNEWNFKLVIAVANLCGGTSGLVLPTVRDILATFNDVKCLVILKLPTSSFSTFRQLQNIKFFFSEYEDVHKSYRGRISLLLYSDVGEYGEASANEWIADFVSSMTAALSTRIVPVNALVQLCEELPGSTNRNQTLSAPFIIRTDKSGEGGLSLIEGAVRSLGSQIAGSLVNVDFRVSEPYQVWGVLCYPEELKRSEKEIVDMKEELAGLIQHSMKQAGINNGFVTIEPVPFGTTWRLYGLLRGIEIRSIRGIDV
jgi:hypothetical protein